MEQKQELTIEEIVARGAKRLDKVLCKYSKANGQVTAANFNVVGRKKVFLQGAELINVGTGYAASGASVQEQVDSLIEAVEADLAKAAEGKPVVSKSEQRRIAVQKGESIVSEPAAPQTEGEKPEDEEVEITDLDKKDGEDATADAPEVMFTKTQLEEICKKRGIKIPRGASKAVLAELIEKDQAAK